MVEAAELSKIAADGLLTVNEKKADVKIEQQVGVLMSAIKEAAAILKFDEERMLATADREQKRRESDV